VTYTPQGKLNVTKMTSLETRALFESAKRRTLATLDQLTAQCPSVRSFPNAEQPYSSCRPEEILQQFLMPATDLWNDQTVSEMVEARDRLIQTCKGDQRPKSVEAHEDTSLKIIRCLQKRSYENPVALLAAMVKIQTGEGCQAIEAARAVVREDQLCLKRFEKSAGCDQWQRLAELAELGANRMTFKTDGAGSSKQPVTR
jgi:hypothetical protein